MNLSELIATMPGITSATTDQAVLDWLTTPSVDKQGEVTKAKLLQWCGSNDRIKNIKLAASNLAHPVNNVCVTAELLLTASDVSTFDTGDAANIAMMGALIAGSVLEQSDVDDLLAMGYSLVSPLEANGLKARMADVEAARAG